MAKFTFALHFLATACVLSAVSFGKTAPKKNSSKEASVSRKPLVARSEYEKKVFNDLRYDIDSSEGDSIDDESKRQGTGLF